MANRKNSGWCPWELYLLSIPENSYFEYLGLKHTNRGSSLCFWKSSLMCISDWKFSLWSLHKRKISPEGFTVSYQTFGIQGSWRKKITNYDRILGPLILLEMHVEKMILNESHWAVHIFGKIYFKDGFNWQAYHYLKNNEKHMKPDIFVELLSVNS